MVKVAYRGYFDDGATFIDQTRQPIEFPCADGWMPPAFVDAVRDMAVGETKRVRVGADEAYEKRTEERVIEVERAKIPADIKLAVGDVMSLGRADVSGTTRGAGRGARRVRPQPRCHRQGAELRDHAARRARSPETVAPRETGAGACCHPERSGEGSRGLATSFQDGRRLGYGLVATWSKFRAANGKAGMPRVD